MGIVELDGYLVRELVPGTLGLLEPADNVMQRRRHPEVLLLETQLLSSVEVVIRVEDGTDRLSSLLVRDRALVLSVVEFLEIELAA